MRSRAPLVPHGAQPSPSAQRGGLPSASCSTLRSIPHKPRVFSRQVRGLRPSSWRRTWAFVERQPLDGVAAAASGRRQSVLVSHARTCTARARPAPGGHVLTPSTSPLLTPAALPWQMAAIMHRAAPAQAHAGGLGRRPQGRLRAARLASHASVPHARHTTPIMTLCSVAAAPCVCVCVCVCARARVRALLLGGAEPQDERSRLHQVRGRLGVAAADGGLAARARGY